MTVRELKEYFSEFGIKPKVLVSDSKEITNEDIKDGKIFQKFVLRENLQNIIDGFDIDNEQICYFYVVLDNIEVETDDSFPPCGGEQDVSVYAYYSIRKRYVDGTDSELTVGRSKVNAVIRVDNNKFSYIKPNLVNNIPNNTDENIIVNVTASYYYKNKKYEEVKTVTQHINSISSWLVESEPTQEIFLSFDNNPVSNKGGIVVAKVERLFSRIYYKKDSCGNKAGEKCEPNLIEDITSKSLITTSNRKIFNINKNIITVAKQPVGASKRECKVTARYLDKTVSESLIQAEGGKITYDYELSFDNGKKISFFDLETSLKGEKKLSILSKKIKYIDGEYEGTEPDDDLKIESDSEWVSGRAIKENDNVYIVLKVNEDNVDKDNDREATLIISNAKETIKLIVSQPALSIIKEEYKCSFNGNGEYTTEEIDKKTLIFHPYKALIYENRERENVKIIDKISITPQFNSSDKFALDVKSIEQVGDNYILSLHNYTHHSIKDVVLKGNLLLSNLDKELSFKSDDVNITVKGNQIIDYDYELCFDGHNKFIELSWDNATDVKHIKVNSLKHKLVNGMDAGEELTPYKIGLYDKNEKEIFNDVFSIKIVDDDVIVFPIKTDKNYEKIFTITQKETGNKILFKLSYKKKPNKFKIPLKVIVYSNNVGKDIWTGENGYLLIDNKENIKLNPCWLSPNMVDNIDTAYNGVIELNEGLHIFETFNVICLEHNSKTHKSCNIRNELYVDKATKNITLQIKI